MKNEIMAGIEYRKRILVLRTAETKLETFTISTYCVYFSIFNLLNARLIITIHVDKT